MDKELYAKETRRLLVESKKKLGDLELQIKELQEESNSLERVVIAYQTVLQGYEKEGDIHDTVKVDWIKLLENKTHKEKMELIAQQNNGRLLIGQVVDILFSNHLVKSDNRNNVYVIVNNALNDLIKEGKVKRIKSGEYYLIGT